VRHNLCAGEVRHQNRDNLNARYHMTTPSRTQRHRARCSVSLLLLQNTVHLLVVRNDNRVLNLPACQPVTLPLTTSHHNAKRLAEIRCFFITRVPVYTGRNTAASETTISCPVGIPTRKLLPRYPCIREQTSLAYVDRLLPGYPGSNPTTPAMFVCSRVIT
jgi:hypothetical protein